MKILVTAGPTREAIDPVRFISNRSSGKMGYAVAEAARDRGHDVHLVSGPVALPPPAGVSIRRVVSAEDMLRAVESELPWCDVLVMAAAVADWRPRAPAASKLKKARMSLTLDLEPVPDILATIASGKGSRLFVGFAAETGAPEEEARRKLKAKSLDLIVANDVSRPDAGFDVDTNVVTLIPASGPAERLPVLSKREVGERILAWIEASVGPAPRTRS